MADKRIAPNSRKLLDDDTIKDIKAGAVIEASGRPTNVMAVNATDVNNIKNGSGTAASLLKGIGFEPVPNDMAALAQPTYHFSFYLDSEYEVEQGKGNEFVIAETGLTGMNIQEVLIDQVVGPNFRTKNAMATNITIRIYEPMGALLPDLLLQAAARKQISNYMKAPWFLKLKLWGYDDEGSSKTIGSGWLWQMVLIDIQTQVSESGSVHTVTAMPLNEVALNDQYCMVGTTIRVRQARSVGEALQRVVQRMNTDASMRYVATSVPFIEYAVEERPYTFDSKVGVKSPFEHLITSSIPQGSDQASSDGYDWQSGHFSPGTDIPAIVDMLMSRSETAVKMGRVSRELPPATGNDDETNIRDVFSVFHRVDTKVEYREYNPFMGDYAKKVTYIVRPYTSTRVLTSVGRALSFDKEKTLNSEKAKYAKDHALLKKQYDYLYTGLNTEVLKFDINLNFTWAVSVPQYFAQQTNSGTPAQFDPTKNVATLQGELNQKYEAFQAISQKFDDEIKALRQMQDESTQTPEKIAAAKVRIEGILAEKAKAQKDNLEFRNQLNAKAAEALRTVPPRRLPPADAGRIVDGEDDIYANARGYTDGKTVDKRYMGADQGGTSILPITINQDASKPGIRTATGTSTDNNPNKSMYGALLNQLYGTFDGNLQDVDLEIRGDPYWLGNGNTNKPYEDNGSDSTPNFFNGEHVFVFRFKMPLGYDDSTGAVALQSDANLNKSGGNVNIFTGFYAAVDITHRFSNGAFTQTLKGTRIPGWTYENIIEGREAEIPDSIRYDNSAGPTSPQVGGAGRGRLPAPDNTTNPLGGQFNEQALLAITMVQEAGGEGPKGMQAVANVVVNRVAKGSRDLSGVIMQNKQFSAWNGVDPRGVWERKNGSAVYQQAYQIAGDVLSGRASDVTGGANGYLNVAVTKQIRGGSLPSWYNPSKITTVIGNHTFLRGVY